MKIIIFAIAMILIFNSGETYAHKKHEQSKKNEQNSPQIQPNRDTTNALGKSGSSMNNNESHDEHKVNDKPEIEFQNHLFEHIHNKLIHFPIALSIIAFLLSLLNIKSGEYKKSIFIIVITAFAFSLLSIITGLLQAGDFVDNPNVWIVDLHQYIGISVAILLLCWLIFLKSEKLKKYGWILGLIISILVITTGFLGGIISHSI